MSATPPEPEGALETRGIVPRVPTLAQVASHAGVGIGTVSRVFNDSPNVSDAMRQRVLTAAEQVGYVPSRKRRAQPAPRPGYVGVLVTFFDEPSAYQRLRGIVSRLQPHHLEVVLYNIASPAQARESVAEISKHDVLEALIVVSLPLTDDEADVLAAAPFPVVLVDTWARGLPTVCVDDRHGGAIATQHLLDLGHRRIAFVGEPPDNPFGFVSSANREAGYRLALDAAGIDVEPELVRHGAHLRSAAKQMTLELLALSTPPTAIVASSDVQAVGIIEAAESVGRAVPADLSVVGYDDIELASLMGLTTVRQPLERSGQRVADLAIQAITSGPGATRAVSVEEMELELVVRSTTRPLR
jgi:LacI family transcriptional regulator